MSRHIFMDRTGPLGKLRRRELEALAKKHGVPVSHDDPAWQMQAALQAKNIMPEMPGPKQEAPDLESMSLFQLRNVCKEREIPYKKTDKKVDLLLKLGV
ncbi:MAG: hypothetical protein ACR2OV_15825 [Hyphomicrobiaceae bacterium]